MFYDTKIDLKIFDQIIILKDLKIFAIDNYNWLQKYLLLIIIMYESHV
jgi:hypothetical protein